MDCIENRAAVAIAPLALLGVAPLGEGWNMPEKNLPQDATGDALRRVLADGSDLSKPMDVEFQIDVPSMHASEAVADGARLIGFSVKIYGTDAEGWTVECRRTMIATHASISSVEAQLDELAKPHGGHSDGWGTFGNAEKQILKMNSMKGALSTRQTWFLVLVVGAGFTGFVLADEPGFGALLVLAVVVGLVVWLLWQAISEPPTESKEVPMEDEDPRCCICGEEYDPEKPHASLGLHVERMDQYATINVLSAAQLGACCRPSCLRDLCDRLREVLPEGCFKYAGDAMEAFSRLKR